MDSFIRRIGCVKFEDEVLSQDQLGLAFGLEADGSSRHSVVRILWTFHRQQTVLQ